MISRRQRLIDARRNRLSVFRYDCQWSQDVYKYIFRLIFFFSEAYHTHDLSSIVRLNTETSVDVREIQEPLPSKFPLTSNNIQRLLYEVIPSLVKSYSMDNYPQASRPKVRVQFMLISGTCGPRPRDRPVRKRKRKQDRSPRRHEIKKIKINVY